MVGIAVPARRRSWRRLAACQTYPPRLAGEGGGGRQASGGGVERQALSACRCVGARGREGGAPPRLSSGGYLAAIYHCCGAKVRHCRGARSSAPPLPSTLAPARRTVQRLAPSQHVLDVLCHDVAHRC